MLEKETFADGVTRIEKSNGKGYLWYEPDNPVDINTFQDELDSCVSPRFSEFPEILSIAAVESSVLLEGAPGAGKSNICQDIELCSRYIGAPVLKISMHINAGTPRHAQETLDLLRAYRELANDTAQRFFILDNVDYAGYGGYSKCSRTRTNAMQYAEAVLPKITDTVADTGIIAIGTAHDDVWRESKWKWDDPAIDRPAKDLIDVYREKYVFKGDMNEASIVELLTQRDVDSVKAVEIAKSLGEAGLLSFFYGNHIQPDLYLDNPKQAIKDVHAGRKQRYKGAK